MFQFIDPFEVILGITVCLMFAIILIIDKTTDIIKINVKKDFIEDLIKRNLDEDIQNCIIRIIEKGVTIKNPKYAVISYARSLYDFEVIVRIKAYDYTLKKKITGYFSIGFFYVRTLSEFHIAFRKSRSIDIKTKLAADIPYGGWFKDARQIEDEKDYYKKRGHVAAG
jgi:hypothetical protein